MAKKDANIGERRRDVLAGLIGRRMKFADQFFGVGQRPYDMHTAPDEDAALYEQLKASNQLAAFQVTEAE